VILLFVFTEILMNWSSGAPVLTACLLGQDGYGEIGELTVYKKSTKQDQGSKG
jgi:hypothetical protein